MPKRGGHGVPPPTLKLSIFLTLKLVLVVGRIVKVDVGAVIVRLQVFAGLKTDRFAGRNCDLFAGARVTANASLPRLHYEDAESAQLDAFTSGQRFFH